MPNIKSAIKRTGVIARKTEKNKIRKSSLRTAIKNAENAVEKSDKSADEKVKEAIKKIDKAVSKGLLHKNTAARKKSNLVKSLK